MVNTYIYIYYLCSYTYRNKVCIVNLAKVNFPTNILGIYLCNRKTFWPSFMMASTHIMLIVYLSSSRMGISLTKYMCINIRNVVLQKNTCRHLLSNIYNVFFFVLFILCAAKLSSLILSLFGAYLIWLRQNGLFAMNICVYT